MGYFNFFGDGEHKVFDYKPIYYDKAEDERRKAFGHVDGSDSKSSGDGSYVPGSYIQGAFRGAGHRTHTPMKRVQTIIGIVTLLLLAAVLFFILKFYSML